MHVGLVDNILGLRTLEETFQAAKTVGAEGVEVSYAPPYGAKVLAQADHRKELEEVARQHGLDVPSLALSFLCEAPSLIGSKSVIEHARAHIACALTLASQIGAGVVLLPFFGKNVIQIEDELSRAGQALLPLVDKAEQARVTLGIEAALNTAQMRFLLDGLGNSDFVKAYYDIGNALARKLDPASDIRELGRSAIVQVHFKDVRMAENAPPDYNVPLGGGDLDLQACVQALRAIGYDGWIVLETPPGDDPAASARTNLACLRGLLGG